MNSMNRETWPVEGFADLHLSGSEPRIFPGVVSRSQTLPLRRDSLVKKGSMSETDGSVGTSGGGGINRSKTSYDASTVQEAEEESDSEMEEAGGRDE